MASAARQAALDALARREHSRRELERKLAARGLEPAAVACALESLAQAGLQDDRRFAEAYVRQRAQRGYGPRRIAQELAQRGVDAALAEAALAAAGEDWERLAAAARTKKFHAAPRTAPERARQIRFLEYRGFASAHIRHALQLTADDENF